MVYITSWPEYAQRAEELYAASPTTTRYVVKWRGDKNLLVLKITDDVTCLKYKTHSSLLLNRFDALNLALMKRMRARPDPPPAPEPAPISPPAPAAAGAGAGVGGAVGGSVPVQVQAAPGTGGKKKKKKGKK
ncbi:signal recognition particle, SRP9/SRP14 subunit [Calocera viscosa TUFC12733]|uniref:Signal recognition particle, SRP9/SRP14 subunit n=1 Tax=Calocera viscosa (strain TUFC12733) TaxID=1330018 RepID=A0A167NBR7_CALVF|nr:signal recognition particle, SRP9/SRP14 subunit [Calocera viscosa TUFC12733]